MVKRQTGTGNGIKRSIKMNAALNVIRQSSAMFFQLITFPYISRILGRSEYGRYSFSASIISYFLLLSGYGISNYAVREGARIREDRDKISALASDLFIINLITAIVAYVLLGVLTLSSAKLGLYKILILIQSFSIFLSAVGLDWINVIYEDYAYITIRYIILQIIALVFIFLFVRGPEDTETYCLIFVLASYGGNLMNLVYIRKYVSFKVRIRVNFQKYILPLTMLFVNSLATMVYVNSDITMLGLYRSDAVVGVYGFSSKIYNFLKYFINSAIVVAVPRLAHMKAQDENTYQIYIEKIFCYLLLVIFPIAVGFTVFGDSVIYIVGGTEYLSGAASFRILMLAFLFALMASVFTNCILIINRCEKYCLISTAVSASTNIALNFILIPVWGMEAAAVTTVIAEIVNLGIQSHFARKILKITIRFSKKNLLTIAGGSCLVALICIVINRTVAAETIYMVMIKIMAGCGLSVVAYGLLLLFSKNEVIYEIIKDDRFKLRKRNS